MVSAGPHVPFLVRSYAGFQSTLITFVVLFWATAHLFPTAFRRVFFLTSSPLVFRSNSFFPYVFHLPPYSFPLVGGLTPRTPRRPTTRILRPSPVLIDEGLWAPSLYPVEPSYLIMLIGINFPKLSRFHTFPTVLLLSYANVPFV